MRSIVLVAVVLANTFPIIRAVSGATDQPDLEALRSFERRNPIDDGRAAIRNNQLFFWGIGGFSMTVPGVDEHKKCRALRSLTRVIPGTTDVIASDEHHRLIGVAERYAERYNVLIREQLEKLGQPVCENGGR